jgi:hypothetical protein
MNSSNLAGLLCGKSRFTIQLWMAAARAIAIVLATQPNNPKAKIL